MNKLEFQGRIYKIFETQISNEKYKKRKIILYTYRANFESGEMKKELHGFQFSGDKCDDLDKFHENEEVKVNFNIRTVEYEKDGETKYFDAIQAWKIELIAKAQQDEPQQGQYQNWPPPQNQQAPQFPQQATNDNDLPF